MKKKIYVGCAIIGAPQEYFNEICVLKERMRTELDCEVMEFIAPNTGSVHEVYMNDIHHAVATCDVMVAEVSNPSLGLGWELATAIEKLRKPVLICAQEGKSVSRLVEGAVGPENPQCSFVRYTDTDDLMGKIENWLSSVS